MMIKLILLLTLTGVMVSGQAISVITTMGLDSTTLNDWIAKFITFFQAQKGSLPGLTLYFLQNCQNKTVRELVNGLPSKFPVAQQPAVQSMVNQGIKDNRQFLQRVKEAAGDVQRFVAKAIPILNDLDQSISVMTNEMLALLQKHQTQTSLAIQVLIRQVFIPRVTAALAKLTATTTPKPTTTTTVKETTQRTTKPPGTV